MAALTGAEVRAMLSSLQVRRTSGGGIAIEAPPQAAEVLASMFYGMAELLARASGPADSAADIPAQAIDNNDGFV